MKNHVLKFFLFLLLVCGTIVTYLYFQTTAQAWGFWAHQRINRLAVFTLPPDMIVFYKKHIEFVTEHAVDPDKRRYAVEDEAPRHFIDLDHYVKEPPYDILPHRWEDAVKERSEDTLKAYGVVPWHTEVMFYRLRNAFENRDQNKILRYSADIGHYIADGHVPLHTSENYNGQMTNQKGIHGFWESRIPELFGNDYDFWVGKAEYIRNPREFIWQYVIESHNALDSVLVFERELNAEYPSDQKYCYENRGVQTMQVYCEGYATDYAKMLNGMQERRMRDAILAVGSLWYTAWVDAGQPDLDKILPIPPTEEEIEEMKTMEAKFQEGKIKGRPEPH